MAAADRRLSIFQVAAVNQPVERLSGSGRESAGGSVQAAAAIAICTRLRPERLLSYKAASAASNRLSFRPGEWVAALFKEQNPKLAVTDSGCVADMKGA